MSVIKKKQSNAKPLRNIADSAMKSCFLDRFQITYDADEGEYKAEVKEIKNHKDDNDKAFVILRPFKVGDKKYIDFSFEIKNFVSTYNIVSCSLDQQVFRNLICQGSR